MKKYILAGILLGATVLQAKQWYVLNGDTMKYKKQLGWIQKTVILYGQEIAHTSNHLPF